MKIAMHSNILALLASIALQSQPTCARAQTSDSLIVGILRGKGVTFSDDNSVTLLPSGREKFDDMFAAIRSARRSVHLEYFNFRDDSVASVLFGILADKAREGVEVRALFDGFGNSSNSRPLRRARLDSIRSSGVEIYEFDPIVFPWINHALHRDHRKIVVIDGKTAYTGGMNVADYYIDGTDAVGRWRDMHCRIEGGAVDALQEIFLRMWNKVSGQDVRGAEYYRGCRGASYMTGLRPDTCATAGKKTVGIINREPLVTNGIIRDFYKGAIDCARDSIKIVNPYLTLNRTLKRSLRRAVRRGVKVEVMVSSRSDVPLTPDCVFYNAHKLMRRGVGVWIYEKGFHHTKTITVDGRFCTVGSANLNARSLNFDYEENAVIIDRCTTMELDDMFERDKKDSFRLTEDSWNEWRTPWKKLAGWLAHLLAPFL